MNAPRRLWTAVRSGWRRFLGMEPARRTEAVRTLLGLLVAAGWITLDDATVSWIVTGVGVLASWALTGSVRAAVSPLPKDNRDMS